MRLPSPRALLLGLSLAIAPLASACLGGTEISAPQVSDPDMTRVTFDTSLHVDIGAMRKVGDGVYVQDLTTGGGATAQAGQTVSVHYTGWLTSGQKFDASRDHGTAPFQFPLGFGRVILGWDEGVVGMKVGGRRRLVIPPSLGYGAQTVGSIPANSVLVFDVELVSIP